MVARAEPGSLGLFEAYGIELEYMIVDGSSLDVAPRADWLMQQAAGEITDEYLAGELAWNNELALHVIEFKLNGPRPALDGLAEWFARDVGRANELLSSAGLRLMPTGMHPWMNPARDLRLWPHDNRVIYETFDRIFSCQGHGWANLQSMHINLPFSGDDQFGRLHGAIRFLLPALPGLAASTPVMDARLTGLRDNRLDVYRNNCARIPSVTGDVIPEPVFTIADYEKRVLERIYADLAPHDPKGVLHEEWVNARGAIARFERMAIEIRVLDTQECPRADLAMARLICATLEALCAEQWVASGELQGWPTATLARGLRAAIVEAEEARIDDRRYLRALGLDRGSATLQQLWGSLADAAAARGALDANAEQVIEHYLREGTLATRIARALGRNPGRTALHSVYGRLCACLAGGELFAHAD